MLNESAPPLLNPQTEADRVRHLLRMRVDEALDAVGGDGLAGPSIQRIHLPVASTDVLAWLAAQTPGPRLYWSGREDDVRVAAWGAADWHAGEGPLGHSLAANVRPLLAQSDPRIRYYGGFSFDTQRPTTGPWRPFGTYRFFLPRFEYRVSGHEAALICNLVLPQDATLRSDILAAIDHLRFDPAPLRGTVPAPINRADAPDLAGWQQSIQWALEAFDAEALEKVVLARRATFQFEDDLDPFLLLKRLEETTPGCFHYAFQFAESSTFIGATPERLFARSGRSIRSEAVAGTRPRGLSQIDDDRLRNELLQSEKDQREHTYVRDTIARCLRPLCTTLDVDDTMSVMRLARGRHLVSRVRGTLHDTVTDFDILRALPPTPAVAGTPTAPALQAIAEQEPFQRGWYAGPIGWAGRDDAEFAVALRCGLVQGQELALYSGAGIVEGSEPDGEWAEIETKIGDFINVLGLDLRRA
ncbi:MAG: isochorismate synthase [Bacteroidota bacterium]